MIRPSHSKALVYSGQHGRLELMELPIPTLEPDQALVRVTGCTLCGSDLHSLHGRRQVPTPTILGHEIVGEIIEMGDRFPRQDIQNQPLHLGDQLTWAIVANCGNCFYCLRGLEQKCEHACKYGHMGFDSGYVLSGGLAEYCVLAAGTQTVKLPSTLPLEVVAPSSCATATVIAALSDLQVPATEDSHIAIIGAGMLGLTACAFAKSRGWKCITAVDPLSEKRDKARQFGASQTASPSEWIAETSSDKHVGCDAVIEMSGAHKMIEPSLQSLRMGGQLVLVGAVFPLPPVAILPERIVRRQLTLRGVHNYRPMHLRTAVEFLSEFGKLFPFGELVPSWNSLSDARDLVESGSAGNVVRIGVKP